MGLLGDIKNVIFNAIFGNDVINKFGYNLDIDTAGAPEAVWSPGGLWVKPSTTTLMEILSLDGGDNPAGAGAQNITIEGLDSNYNKVVQTVPTNGLGVTPIPIAMIRVYRAYCEEVGATGWNIGKITIRGTGGGSTYAEIPATEGQTQMAVYTIAKGMKGYLKNFHVDLVKTGGATIITGHIYTQCLGKSRRSRNFFVLDSNDKTEESRAFFGSIKIPEKCDVWIEISSTTANDAEVVAEFDLLEV